MHGSVKRKVLDRAVLKEGCSLFRGHFDLHGNRNRKVVALGSGVDLHGNIEEKGSR